MKEEKAQEEGRAVWCGEEEKQSRGILTGDSEVIAEEGSAEGADDAGEDEVAGDLALVELGPPGGRPAAAKPAGHLSLCCVVPSPLLSSPVHSF